MKMAKRLKMYDVYFTLEESASILVEAHSKEDAEEEANVLLEDKEELVQRLLNAIASGGLKITHIERAD